ncbi:type II toxin-antitoxin system HicB family antitoxin [Sphingomonas paeninsulae]|uniref:Type II toxin-antitoxin system HicB family antitoxin n=1 Tax=Sphingomonas paeninsulae TaxID=2319844 RepID=A0A494TQC9_SPHPE|nr:type II toxin-antitoxin system HicB family antitoxin [Sphingomonas paeninsulae]AYJ87668.1 type II toxin-antitoxin system HicB family antitoxin [Sphingomonas paeninsulae]
MTVMTYKGYAATVDFDADDMILVGKLAGIDDNISFHADDGKAFIEAFHEAVEDYIATCAKIGKAPQKPYSGKVMFRIDPSVHAQAALAAQLSGKSMNAWGRMLCEMLPRR